MADNENKTIKNEKIVFKDEVYPYIDDNNEVIHKEDTSFDENMEKAKNVEIARNTYVYTNAEDSFKENRLVFSWDWNSRSHIYPIKYSSYPAYYAGVYANGCCFGSLSWVYDLWNYGYKK